MILKWTEIALDDETVAIDTITTPNCSKGRERKKEYRRLVVSTLVELSIPVAHAAMIPNYLIGAIAFVSFLIFVVVVVPGGRRRYVRGSLSFFLSLSLSLYPTSVGH